MSRQPTAKAGKRLGRYRIERELGRRAVDEPRSLQFTRHRVDPVQTLDGVGFVDGQVEEAGKPVLLIEYSVNDDGNQRIDRWYSAYDQQRELALPFVTVDSGWRWTCGSEDFRTVYKGMVDAALAHAQYLPSFIAGAIFASTPGA